MGYVEIKPPASSKSVSTNAAAVQNSSVANVSHSEPAGIRAVVTGTQHEDTVNSSREHISRVKPADGRSDRTESISRVKSDQGLHKLKGGSMVNGSDTQASVPLAPVQAGTSRSGETQNQIDESAGRTADDGVGRVAVKAEPEGKAATKRSVPGASVSKTPKQDQTKDDNKTVKPVGRISSSSTGDKDVLVHLSENRHGVVQNLSSAVAANGVTTSASAKGSSLSTKGSDTYGNELKTDGGAIKSVVKDGVAEISDMHRAASRQVHSPRHDSSVSTSKSNEKLQKRASPADEPDRLSKRRKGDTERDLEAEVRVSERERSLDSRPVDLDKAAIDEQGLQRNADKSVDKVKDKVNDRYDRDYRDRSDRPEKSRSDDILPEKSRDRSIERYGRERSVERGQERGSDRNSDRPTDKARDERSKDDRSKLRYSDADKSHDERFHGQSLPPPPPLPPHMVPQSVNAGRRDEDGDRRTGTTRHAQRLSPRHDDKERRRSEENSLGSQDDLKRRKEEDFRERKRDERDGLPMKVDERGREREREREKPNLLKEDMEANAASKRRKLKRDLPSIEAGEYSPVAPPPLTITLSQPYDGRDRGERQGALLQRGYLEEPPMRIHGKDVASKMARRDADPMYDRDWDEDKRQRAEQKRRHRK